MEIALCVRCARRTAGVSYSKVITRPIPHRVSRGDFASGAASKIELKARWSNSRVSLYTRLRKESPNRRGNNKSDCWPRARARVWMEKCTLLLLEWSGRRLQQHCARPLPLPSASGEYLTVTWPRQKNRAKEKRPAVTSSSSGYLNNAHTLSHTPPRKTTMPAKRGRISRHRFCALDTRMPLDQYQMPSA